MSHPYIDLHYAVVQHCVVSLSRERDPAGGWTCVLRLDEAEADRFAGETPPTLELRGTIERPSAFGVQVLARVCRQRVIPVIELEVDGLACPFVVCMPEELAALHEAHRDYSYIVSEQPGERLAITDWVACIDGDPDLEFIPNCPHAAWHVEGDIRQLEWHRGAVCCRPTDEPALAKLKQIAARLGGRLHARWAPG